MEINYNDFMLRRFKIGTFTFNFCWAQLDYSLKYYGKEICQTKENRQSGNKKRHTPP